MSFLEQYANATRVRKTDRDVRVELSVDSDPGADKDIPGGYRGVLILPPSTAAELMQQLKDVVGEPAR